MAKRSKLRRQRFNEKKQNKNPEPVNAVGLIQETTQPAVDVSRLQERSYNRAIIEAVTLVLRELVRY